ncbi:MAG: sensor histidine kinase [Acidimicrobiia bacterium]
MTLRARLLVGTVVVAIVLVAAAIVVTRTTERFLVDRVDEQLAAAIPFAERGLQSALPTGRPPDDADDDGTNPSTLFVGAIDPAGGLVIQATPNLSEEDPPVPDIDPARARAAARSGRPEPFTVGSLSGNDTRYRVLAVAVDGPGDIADVGLVALPLTDVDAAVERLLVVEGIATVLVLTLLGLVTFWVVRLGVRPIRRMTEAAKVIADGDLSHRVPAARDGTEAADLGAAFNVMLGRIEGAFARQAEAEARLRQFVTDASHELRTPVTTISGYAQLYRDGGLDDPGELTNAMRRTGQEATRMAGLIDAMLLLARLDQGQPLEQRPVDLGVVARDAADDARAVEPDRPVSVVAADGVIVQADEDRLRQVVSNLVRNALAHTRAPTPLHLRVERAGDQAVLVVRDEGPGMDADAAAHAFERFYRADPGRSRDRGGSGLGLAIVRSIVEAHGGRVTLDAAPGTGTTVCVELPLAAPALSANTQPAPDPL